jgi:hypothetical protein
MEFSLGLPRARLEKSSRGPRDVNGRRIKKKARAANRGTATMITKSIIAPQAKNLKWNMGPFWRLPPGLKVSDSVMHKFSLISHIFSYNTYRSFHPHKFYKILFFIFFFQHFYTKKKSIIWNFKI